MLRGNNFYDNSYCKRNYYEKSIRESNDKFTVQEFEAFQVNKIRRKSTHEIPTELGAKVPEGSPKNQS
jgi:hypothetical protein